MPRAKKDQQLKSRGSRMCLRVSDRKKKKAKRLVSVSSPSSPSPSSLQEARLLLLKAAESFVLLALHVFEVAAPAHPTVLGSGGMSLTQSAGSGAWESGSSNNDETFRREVAAVPRARFRSSVLYCRFFCSCSFVLSFKQAGISRGDLEGPGFIGPSNDP